MMNQEHRGRGRGRSSGEWSDVSAEWAQKHKAAYVCEVSEVTNVAVDDVKPPPSGHVKSPDILPGPSMHNIGKGGGVVDTQQVRERVWKMGSIKVPGLGTVGVVEVTVYPSSHSALLEGQIEFDLEWNRLNKMSTHKQTQVATVLKQEVARAIGVGEWQMLNFALIEVARSRASTDGADRRAEALVHGNTKAIFEICNSDLDTCHNKKKGVPLLWKILFLVGICLAVVIGGFFGCCADMRHGGCPPRWGGCFAAGCCCSRKQRKYPTQTTEFNGVAEGAAPAAVTSADNEGVECGAVSLGEVKVEAPADPAPASCGTQQPVAEAPTEAQVAPTIAPPPPTA